MWLITTRGFYSVVAHRDDAEALLVRARAREDLVALRDLLPALVPFEDERADYRWRAVVRRRDWERAVQAMAAEIDYPNFKNAVAERQGKARASLYSQVWVALLQLQRG